MDVAPIIKPEASNPTPPVPRARAPTANPPNISAMAIPIPAPTAPAAAFPGSTPVATSNAKLINEPIIGIEPNLNTLPNLPAGLGILGGSLLPLLVTLGVPPPPPPGCLLVPVGEVDGFFGGVLGLNQSLCPDPAIANPIIIALFR